MVGIILGRGGFVFGLPFTLGKGGAPLPGYFFLRGKLEDGNYIRLSGLNADASRTNLQGKA